MTPALGKPLLKHLSQILDSSHGPGASDAELLERFILGRDSVAFELLMWRHQQMVLSVCRRVTRDLHDAEDAFQATFLALVRKANSLGRIESVAGWLHRVAYHVALRGRKRSAKRPGTDLDLDTVASLPVPAEEAGRREMALVLDEEVNRLPKHYRIPVVMCYLEGKTYREAGRQLGLAVGTLSARLTRARALLRARLTRRGIALGGAALATLLGERSVAARLLDTTLQAAMALAAGRTTAEVTSTAVAALTEGALRNMFLTKLKFVAVTVLAATVLLAGLFVAGAGLLMPAAEPDRLARQPDPPKAENEKKDAHVDHNGDPLPAGALFRFGSQRWQHDGPIRASVLSADGKLLATTSGRSVAVWDLATGKAVRRFLCENRFSFSTPGIAFSPDGEYLGYVQKYDFGCVLDLKSGKEVARFEGGSRHGHALCQFTPDGREFIVAGAKDHVIFWDLKANREARATPAAHVSLLSPDAQFCVRIDEKKALFLSDARTGEEMDRLDVPAALNGIENGVAFAPDSQTLAVAYPPEVQVRDFPSGKLRVAFPFPDSTKIKVDAKYYSEYGVSFSADGKTLHLVTKGGLVHRWDLATRKELPPLREHAGGVSGAHTLPDGKTVVTTGKDGLIRRWDRETGKELAEPEGYFGRLHAGYSPDGRYAAIGDGRGRLDLWDARTGKPLRVFQSQGPAVTKVAFVSDGKTVAAALADGTVHFWPVPAGEKRRVLPGDKEHNLGFVYSMSFSPDGRRLLIAGGKGQTCLWDVAEEKLCWSKGAYHVAFTPDGKIVVAEAGAVNVLDTATGQVRGKLPAEVLDRWCEALAVSPDGRHIAVGRSVGAVDLHSMGPKATAIRFQAVDPLKNPPPPGGVASPVRGLAFSPDGQWLCTVGCDGSVRLWDVATQIEVLRLGGHVDEAEEVAFGADGRTVLTCGSDTQAYLWSLRPPLDEKDKPNLDALWTGLAAEPKAAYRALWRMSELADAVAFLRGKIKPVPPVENERLMKLIADLDSDQFTVREAAHKTLADLSGAALPAMRKALEAGPPPEGRRRLTTLIERVETKALSPEELRTRRGIDVLERQGTVEARQVLKELAAGAAGAWPTVTAQAALKRLER